MMLKKKENVKKMNIPNRKRKHKKKGKKKRKKRNSISVTENKIAWEPSSTDPPVDPPVDAAGEAATKRAKIKKQRSVVDHLKRMHSKFKSKKYKKKRERILFALKVFGGIVITAAEVAFIFA